MRLIVQSTTLLMLSATPAFGQWQKQEIRSDADFRGLCVVNSTVVWVSGTKGTYAHTTNSGATWSVGVVPGAEKLDFRDVKAFSESTAYLLSAGPGEASRIYKTGDAGKTWALQFKNAEPSGFFDAMAFWNATHGVALGDPVRGKFQLVSTRDGGTSWQLLPDKALPAALPGEGAFAASGTCVVAYGESDVWFGTGGGKTARVFHSNDRGQTWTPAETPVIAGVESAGIFSLAFRDRKHGLVAGGDFRKPLETGVTAAATTDGGRTWTAIDRPFPYRSAVARAKDGWVVVGTSGSDLSRDDGASWAPLDRQNYNAVGFAATGEGWAAGPKGRIAHYAK
jgi:photosystem II stability/assembly factor-like uncharacterized protein